MTVKRAQTIDEKPGAQVVFPAQPANSREAEGRPGTDEDDAFEGDLELPEPTRAPSVRWAPNDRASPCYSHLLADGQTSLATPRQFELSRAEMELLIKLNGYRPTGYNDIIAFGVRGARLRGPEKAENVDRLALEDTRPDHLNYRCIVGFYYLKTGKFSAYTGSTVPWQGYMAKGMRLNMLPTGCYIYKIGTHAPATRSRWVTPALRLSDAKGAHTGAATVLRTTDNLVFGHDDEWDTCEPADNIHCAYSNTGFSSLGCQTIKGGMFDGLWADFARVLKTMPTNARVDYVLTTGAEVAMAGEFVRRSPLPSADDLHKALGRLRTGSEGERVERLQAKLGVPASGYFGAGTKEALVEFQKSRGIPIDGIYSPAIDARLGWGIFAPAPPPAVSQPVALSSAPPPAASQQPATPVSPVADAPGAPAAQPGTAGPSPATVAALAALAGKPTAATPAAASPASMPAAVTVPSPQPVPTPAVQAEATAAAMPAPQPESTAAPPVTSETQPQAQSSPAPIVQPAPATPAPSAFSAPTQAPAPQTPVAPPEIPTPSQPTQVAAASPPTSEPHLLLTAETLRDFAPRARLEYAQVLGTQGNDVLTRFAINRNDLRFCHFMAQVAHECGEFTIVEENLNYSAKRMVEIFGAGRHSAAIGSAEAQRLAGNKEAFAERVYGLGNPRKARDLGNTEPGDGYRYRGRGFLQITGRAAYREMGKRIGADLEAEPDKAGEPLYALMTAAAFWDSRKLNTYADQDNIEIITKRINGGSNGLDDRKRKYAKAVDVFADDHENAPSRSAGPSRSAPAPRHQLEYGDLGPDVLRMKQMLSAAGYDGFAMDEDFSRATHVAVVRFQLDRGLPANGIVDAMTWDALEAAAPSRGLRRSPSRANRERREHAGGATPQGSGRWLRILGLFMLLASIAVIVLRIVEHGKPLPPQSARDWIEMGFTWFMALASAGIFFAGVAQARPSTQQSRTSGRGEEVFEHDEGIRPIVNLETN